MKDYKIKDIHDFYGKSYVSTVFFRNDRVKDKISAFKWFRLTIIELIIGVEILESIIMSFSLSPYSNYKNLDKDEYGATCHLSLFIPYGIINCLVRNSAVEVLYYKYYHQYLLLTPVEKYDIDDQKNTINCTRTRFAAKKELFSELIAFRRVYELTWFLLNLSIDILVYYFSDSLQAAIATAIGIEALRRLLTI
ncbi:hypothetical protein [Aliivibrio fischeri]|uniref:hypothetical protein n=1 Tax=Aliivibrio fischeri TaxID=668 RepID=UPI001111FE37|nr:hypothetical protein [Aliivibrio fischeri]